MKFWLITLLVPMIVSCGDKKKHSPGIDIWKLDTRLTPSDSIVKDPNGNLYLIKYGPEGVKSFVGQYPDGKLNGQIQLYGPDGAVAAMGSMKENLPQGLWTFGDPQRPDSAKIIMDSTVIYVDTADVRFDTLKIPLGFATFKLPKPKSWEILSHDSKGVIGIVENANRGNGFRAFLTTNVDTFANNAISMKFAVSFIIDQLRQNFQNLTITDENYLNNSLGWYYQMEMKGISEQRDVLLVVSLFIEANTIYTITGVAEDKKDGSNYLYQWLYKQIPYGFSKASN